MTGFRPILAVAVLLVWQSGATAVDKILTTKNIRISGTIVRMSSTEVEIKAGTRVSKVPVNEIKRLTYDKPPRQLRLAQVAIENGQPADARNKLGQVKVARLKRPFVKQEIAFYKALAGARLALQGEGNHTRAVRDMLSFRKNNRNNYHYFECVDVLGELAMEMGRYPKASGFYAELAKAPWPDYQLRAMVRQGRALRSQGEFAAALEKFSDVIGSDASNADTQRYINVATLGKAVCLAESGKHDEGIELVNSVIAKTDGEDVQLMGRTYITHGLCFRKANRDKDALLAYLHVDLLYNSDPQSHAEALYHLADLWPRFNKPDRALAAQNLLESRYPTSVWNKRP